MTEKCVACKLTSIERQRALERVRHCSHLPTNASFLAHVLPNPFLPAALHAHCVRTPPVLHSVLQTSCFLSQLHAVSMPMTPVL